MSVKKKWNIMLVVMMVWAIFAAFVGMRSTNNLVTFSKDDYESMESGWTYEVGQGIQGVETLAELPVDDNNQVTVYHQIPEGIDESDALVFQAGTYDMTVYIEGNEIYRYGYKKNSVFSMPEAAWHVLCMKESYAGKEIKIQLHSYFDTDSVNLGNVMTGDVASIGFSVIEKNWFGIVTSFLLLALAIFLLVVWFFIRKKYSMDTILYLAIFSGMVFIWSFSETHILNFFIHNATSITILVFEVLAIIPFPIGAFLCIHMQTKEKSIIQWIFWSTSIVFVICNVLHFTKVMNLVRSLFLVHLNYIFCCVLVLLVFIKKMVKKNGDLSKSRNAVIGLGMLFAMVLVDIGRYYMIPYTDYSTFTRIGLFLFIILIGIDSLERNMKMILLAQKAQIYEELAYHDSLTGIYNRTAFDEKLCELNKKQLEDGSVFVMIADVNGLKYVNDHFGHRIGDVYIQSASRILVDSLSDIGGIYRTGGDEFTVIIENHTNREIMLHVEELEHQLMKEEEERKLGELFSYGTAIFEKEQDTTLNQTIARADEAMYVRKQDFKQYWQKKLV